MPVFFDYFLNKMPQLDKMNWFFIFSLLILGLAFFIVVFIKRNFYSWRKIIILKQLTQFNINLSNTNNFWLFDFFTFLGHFLTIRKVFLNNLLLKNTTVFFDTVKSFENNLQKK